MAETVLGASAKSFGAVLTANFMFAYDANLVSTTETFYAWPIRSAGTFSHFTVDVDANGTSRSFAMRRNLAASNFSVTMTDSTAGRYRNWTSSQHYAAGDTFDLEFLVTGTAYTLTSYSMVYTADSGTTGLYGTGSINAGVGGPYFTGPGCGYITGADTSSKPIVRAPGTYQNLVASIDSNTVTSTIAFVSRKNGVNGNMTVSITASTTGVFEDTTHSDSLASGDAWGASLGALAVGAMSIRFGVTVLHTGITSELFAGNPSFAFNAVARYAPFLVSPSIGTSVTEANVPVTLGVDGTISNLRLNVFSNSMASTATVGFRKNGVTGAQTMAVGAGATGNFEDTTHSDFVLGTDVINLIQTGGTSGTLATGWVASTLTPISFGWFGPLSEPVRVKPGRPAQVQFQAFDTQPFVPFSWYEPLSEPVRVKPGVHAARQQFLAFDPQPFVPFGWFEALAQPQRLDKRGLHASLQQAFTFNPQPIVPFGWFEALSNPQRLDKKGLHASLQQAWTGPNQLRPTPDVTAVLDAAEQFDTFLGGGTEFDPPNSGEIAVQPLQRRGEVGVVAAPPVPGETAVIPASNVPGTGVAVGPRGGSISVRKV